MSRETESKIGFIEWSRHRRTFVGLALAGSALAACSANATPVPGPTVTVTATAPSETPSPSESVEDGINTKGECHPLNVYAQNVWPATPDGKDYGAAVRSEPDRQSERLYGLTGNHPLTVRGWVQKTEPLSPQNPSDRNGQIWFHIPGGGWVNNSAVRMQETEPDPDKGYNSEYKDKSEAVPASADCKIE